MIEGKTVKSVEEQKHVTQYITTGYTIHFKDGTSVCIHANGNKVVVDVSAGKEPSEALCYWCGRTVGVKSDDTLKSHRAAGGKCAGSGQRLEDYRLCVR